MAEPKNLTVNTGTGHIIQLTITPVFLGYGKVEVRFDGLPMITQTLDDSARTYSFQVNENRKMIRYDIETTCKLNISYMFTFFGSTNEYIYHNTIKRDGQIIFSD